MVAVIALVGGLTMAWWQSSKGSAQLRLSVLVTRVVAANVDDGKGRQRLRKLELLSPAEPDSDVIGWRHVQQFGMSGAPQAVGPLDVTVAAGTTHIWLRCTYQLGSGSTMHTGLGKVAVNADVDDIQVVDAGRCDGKDRPMSGVK